MPVGNKGEEAVHEYAFIQHHLLDRGLVEREQRLLIIAAQLFRDVVELTDAAPEMLNLEKLLDPFLNHRTSGFALEDGKQQKVVLVGKDTEPEAGQHLLKHARIVVIKLTVFAGVDIHDEDLKASLWIR